MKKMNGLKTLNDGYKRCELCKRDEIDEFKYGPLFEREGCVAHYYCVLFSNSLPQNGEDSEGILGFLIQDLKAEIEKGKRKICAYCNKGSATVSCANKKCKQIFHYPCGIEKKSLHQFKDSFKSFCFKHRPRQYVPPYIFSEAEKSGRECPICKEDINFKNSTENIWANCCLMTWYHRNCLQRHALSSGYFFKCAICSNNKEFKKWVEHYGIFVPQQDASWEVEPNAYMELSSQYCKCDAALCKCPDGPTHSVENTIWEIILCKTCGSHGMHVMCGNLKFHNPRWECETCKEVEKKVRPNRLLRKSKNLTCRSRRSRCSEITENTSTETTSATSCDERLSRRNNIGVKRKRNNTDEQDQLVLKKMRVNDRLFEEEPRNEEELHVQVTKVGDETGGTEKADHANNGTKNDHFECAQNSTVKENRHVATSNNAHNSLNEEISSLMEEYRNFQMVDIKYRVKKEMYTISSDESENSDVEIILERKDLNIEIARHDSSEVSILAEKCCQNASKDEVINNKEISDGKQWVLDPLLPKNITKKKISQELEIISDGVSKNNSPKCGNDENILEIVTEDEEIFVYETLKKSLRQSKAKQLHDMEIEEAVAKSKHFIWRKKKHKSGISADTCFIKRFNTKGKVLEMMSGENSENWRASNVKQDLVHKVDVKPHGKSKIALEKYLPTMTEEINNVEEKLQKHVEISSKRNKTSALRRTRKSKNKNMPTIGEVTYTKNKEAGMSGRLLISADHEVENSDMEIVEIIDVRRANTGRWECSVEEDVIDID